MNIEKTERSMRTDFKCKVSFDGVLSNLQVWNWRRATKVRCLVISNVAYFKSEQDAMFFLLSKVK